MTHLQQIEARRRYPVHIGLVGLLVSGGDTSLLPVHEEPWPGFLGLADKDDICEIAKVAFVDADPRTADNRECAEPLELSQDLSHAHALHDHPGYPNDVGFGAPGEIDWLDILINDCQPVMRWGDRCEQRQRCDRQQGPLANEG